MTPIEKICKELLSGTNVLRYNKDIEGQRVSEDAIIIGSRLASKTGFPSALCHELGHFVEIDDARVRMYGWGLNVRKQWVYDRYCYEPITAQCTERELRVCAYQAHLHNTFGVTEPIEETIDALKYLPDTVFVPIETGETPYADNRTHNLNYNEIQKSQHRWRMNQLEELMVVYTLDRFMSEFHRKVKMLEERECKC